MEAIDRLSPALQYQVVNALGWTGLRPVQEQSTHAILDGTNCVILAPTAGGKTEAATQEEASPYGNKYDKDLNVVEIAKRIRADIKQAIADGIIPAIKTSVRISRYSMGRSIDIYITEAPFAVVNPEWTAARASGASVREMDGIGQLTAEAKRVRDVVADIHAAYNYDRSDSMTDYYDVNFGGSVSYAWEMLR